LELSYRLKNTVSCQSGNIPLGDLKLANVRVELDGHGLVATSALSGIAYGAPLFAIFPLIAPELRGVSMQPTA
jgi:hypothetical protein